MTNQPLAISPFTMPAALAAADLKLWSPYEGDPIPGSPVWRAGSDNAEQSTWLASFRRRANLAAGMPEIKSHATAIAAQHVAWLKAEGWEAQVTQGTRFDLFLASTLNIVAKWVKPGRAYRDGGIDRVLLKHEVYSFPTKRGEHPVVEVVTQHASFSFCFQQVDAAPRNTAELHNHALGMVCRQADRDVHLDFPQVDLRVKDEARYMLGLRSGENVVTQAAEQLRLELNEIGGRASAAAEVAVTRGMGPSVVKITGPFIVAVNRNGAPVDEDKVVFAAYCDQSTWKAPAAGRI